MKEKDIKSTMQIHSQAKVEFYHKYLELYLVILYNTKYIQVINIYDVFCGMGLYTDGHKGSPIVAYDTIKKIFESNGKIKKVHLFINDIDESRVYKVKEYIDKNNMQMQCCEVSCFHENADDFLIKICNKVTKTNSNSRNLIFIDPYGYKQIKKEIIYQLMQNHRTEIILFLPISHMYRFTQYAVANEDISQYKPLSDFVKSFFSKDHPIVRNENITIIQYIDYIKGALSFDNLFYTTSYHIERNKNSYFALFFISPNLLGYEKNLEAKWALDTLDGNGFDTPTEVGLFDEFFEKEAENKQSMRLTDLLMSFIKESPRTNIEIYKYVLDNEFLPKHANQVLSDLQNKKRIEVLEYGTTKEARKKSFYLSYQYSKEVQPKIIINDNENNKNRVD